MNSNTTSWARIAALAVGYIVAIVGVLSFLTIPFYASLGLMAVVTLIAFLSDDTKIPMPRNSWIVLLAGCVLIISVLAFFGNDRIRYWTPFPAGYIPAWFGCFQGIRHVQHLVLRNLKHETAT